MISKFVTHHIQVIWSHAPIHHIRVWANFQAEKTKCIADILVKYQPV